MTGRFAGLIHDDQWNYSIAGWVCAPELADSVNVELWVGGGPGVGQLFKTVTANGSEDGDQSAVCHSPVGNRSFRYALSPWERTVYGGQSVYALAKSVGGTIQDLNMGDSASQRVIPSMDRFVQWLGWDIENTGPAENSRTFKLTVRNTGNVMWGATNDAGHVFLHVGPTDQFIGGPKDSTWDFELPHPVAPGEDVSFEWTVPLGDEQYTVNYSAQMRVDALGFGDLVSKPFYFSRSFKSRCPKCEQP